MFITDARTRVKGHVIYFNLCLRDDRANHCMNSKVFVRILVDYTSSVKAKYSRGALLNNVPGTNKRRRKILIIEP